MSGRKVLLLGSVVLLTLALVFGCSLLPRENVADGDGWYIKLQIQAPASKGITVDELDVTGMLIEVMGPGEDVLQSIDWEASEGSQEYLVAVPQPGEYRLEVTHFADREGVLVQAEESAAFQILAMKITVIDLVPGGIGLIWVEGEGAQGIDLTGYWDDTTTWADGSVEHSILYMLQTGSTVNMPNGITLTLVGLTFSGQIWIPDFESYITLASTVSADGSEINGTQSGFPFGGGSATFHMVRSTFSFGRLDLEGNCAGQPVSLHTDYGYARRSATTSTYSHEISLSLGSFWGNLQLTSNGALSVGTYPVAERWPEPVGQIRASISEGALYREASGGSIELSRYDSLGMTGIFSLDFDEGTLTGSFDVTFGANSGHVTVDGWLSGTTTNPYAQVSVRNHTDFEIGYLDQDLNVRLWCDIDGALRKGAFVVPNDVHINLSWSSDSGMSIHGYPSWDLPGTMTISSLSDTGFTGDFGLNFEQGGSLSGIFDLSFLP